MLVADCGSHTLRMRNNLRRTPLQYLAAFSSCVGLFCFVYDEHQWGREVLKMKKKDALCGAAKVAARMPPGGAQKPRRGGWCECCERQYIGTMSEVSEPGHVWAGRGGGRGLRREGALRELCCLT